MMGHCVVRSTHRCRTRWEGQGEAATRPCLFVGATNEEVLLVSVEEDLSAGLRSSCIYQPGLAWYIRPVETEVGRGKIHSTTASEHWRLLAQDSCPSRLWVTARCLEAQVVAVGLAVSKLTCPGERLSCQRMNSDTL